MTQSSSTATERESLGLAKPEAVATVQCGHHGKDSIPPGPAYCNQAGLCHLGSGLLLSQAKSDDGRVALGGISERIGWAVKGLGEDAYNAQRSFLRQPYLLAVLLDTNNRLPDTPTVCVDRAHSAVARVAQLTRESVSARARWSSSGPIERWLSSSQPMA